MGVGFVSRSERLRVAHVIHSLGSGGAEALLVELAEPAREAGIDVVVVGLSDADDDRTALALRRSGVPVHQLHLRRYDPRAVRQLGRVLTRERVDLVHTHLKHADLVGGLAAHRARLPAVSTLHVIEDSRGTTAHRARVRLAALARQRLFRRVVVLSRAQRDWYARFSPGTPTRLIPNGIRPPTPQAPVTEVRSRLGVAPDELLAVTVSLMRPEKGHDVLLDAVRLMRTRQVVVALAGDGPLLESVRARVRADPELTRRVRVLGFRHDVDDLLAAADLVVHPSLADALPTALISALGAGRPIVATEVGGIPDVTAGGCAVLVPPSDPAALATALDDVVGDLGRRTAMGAAARQRFGEHYAAPVWVARLADLYREVLHRSGSDRSTTCPTHPAPPPSSVRPSRSRPTTASRS